MGWAVGDEIVIGATESDGLEGEKFTISAITIPDGATSDNLMSPHTVTLAEAT